MPIINNDVGPNFHDNFMKEINSLTTYHLRKKLDHPLISMLANQEYVREKKVRLFVLTRHEIKGRASAIHADIHIVRLSRRMC